MTISEKAQEIFDITGTASPKELILEDVIAYYDGDVRNAELKNCDGRMVMKGDRAIVSINQNIVHPQRRRFILAHELGHMILHRGKEAVFSDDEHTLEDYRSGSQEREANAFAAALLMPGQLFAKVCLKRKFGSETIRYIAEHFGTSISSTVFRFLEYGNHPICIVYSQDGIVKYYMKSADFRHYLKNIKGQPVPSDSVANEFYTEQKIYSQRFADQQIFKPTWFNIWKEEEEYQKMYEYCIVLKELNATISIIWEK